MIHNVLKRDLVVTPFNLLILGTFIVELKINCKLLFMVVHQKAVVITGVSSGIGQESAKFLISRGLRVFGSVRRLEDADRCRTELGPNFEPLLFDVRDVAAVRKAAEEVSINLNNEYCIENKH